MVSFQNGVVYGTGNVLGYDKVGPEYVINEEQAETVRRIYDLYLAGNGYHKIMKQLEKEGRRTAMGKTMWHYATVGHILKNRLYCGELEYRKEYVPEGFGTGDLLIVADKVLTVIDLKYGKGVPVDAEWNPHHQ